MFGIKNIFEKSKAKLYYIEIDDDRIDKELADVIVQIQKKTVDFKSHLKDADFLLKDSWLSEVRLLLMGFMKKLNKLRDDLQRVIGVEMENKDYLIIKDDAFLVDKKQQLEIMFNELTSFIDILDQRPSTSDLETDLLEKIISQINSLNDAIQKIILDDIKLQFIYKKLMDL